jgi:hypothetical protein
MNVFEGRAFQSKPLPFRQFRVGEWSAFFAGLLF